MVKQGQRHWAFFIGFILFGTLGAAASLFQYLAIRTIRDTEKEARLLMDFATATCGEKKPEWKIENGKKVGLECRLRTSLVGQVNIGATLTVTPSPIPVPPVDQQERRYPQSPTRDQ